MQNTKKKSLKAVLCGAAFVLTIGLVSALAVLYGKDDYAGVELNGWDVIPRLYPAFWVWVKALAVVGLFSAYMAYVTYHGIGIGRNIRGELTYVLFVAICCISFAAPWSIVGAAKANGGFTLPKPKTAIVEHAKSKGWADAELILISYLP